MLPLVDYAGLYEAQKIDIQTRLALLHSLGDLVAWAFAQKPAYEIAEVVVQDEFTHDVVLPWKDGLTLVFDTT